MAVMALVGRLTQLLEVFGQERCGFGTGDQNHLQAAFRKGE